MRGRKPQPTAIRRANGNPGKRAYNHAEPQPPKDLPDCPPHLSDIARAEWERVAETLHDIGVLTSVDRAALAAYCQAYGRWVEAEEQMKKTPAMLKTPSGYVQQSPWMSVANKQLEIMGRYMVELGMTPASWSRVAVPDDNARNEPVTIIRLVGMSRDEDGNLVEHQLPRDRWKDEPAPGNAKGVRYLDLDDRV
jgi:P27 family predicted phage terminase small subunit